MSTCQREATRVSPSHAIARRAVIRVEVNAANISGIFVGVAIESNDISTATVKATLADLGAVNRLSTGRDAGSASLDTDGDGVFWAIAQGLIGRRRETDEAKGGAGARGVC